DDESLTAVPHPAHPPNWVVARGTAHVPLVAVLEDRPDPAAGPKHRLDPSGWKYLAIVPLASVEHRLANARQLAWLQAQPGGGRRHAVLAAHPFERVDAEWLE